MRVQLSFNVDGVGDRIDFDAPEKWNEAFGPPLLKATIEGVERLFYRVEFSTYYHEVVAEDVTEVLPKR